MFKPNVPQELASYIVEVYVDLRQKVWRTICLTFIPPPLCLVYTLTLCHTLCHTLLLKDQDVSGNDQSAMTARALLSILRLSQALASLRFSDVVAVRYSVHLSVLPAPSLLSLALMMADTL